MNREQSLSAGELVVWGEIAETFITAAEDIETTMVQFESPTEQQSVSVPGEPTFEAVFENQTNPEPRNPDSNPNTGCLGQTDSRI